MIIAVLLYFVLGIITGAGVTILTDMVIAWLKFR